MNADDLILISVDDHIVEPADMFDRHVPASLKDAAPKYVVEENGDGYWQFEDRRVANLGVNSVVGRAQAG